MSEPLAEMKKQDRLVSLDAYRGFVMLAMVSGGFAFKKVVDSNPQLVTDNTPAMSAVWNTLAYQFGHVEWTGCSFWDLIQPSFMFMVGVAMPFSYSRRRTHGQGGILRFAHVLFRSMILVLLGVFLSSNWGSQTNFTFVNVLTQIGLGYAFVYLLLNRHFVLQLLAAMGVLGGYWYYFYQYQIPQAERAQLTEYLDEKVLPERETDVRRVVEIGPFDESQLSSHWNKHTNAAAALDREFLNRFPRAGDKWKGEKFWVNNGGYQTLNFIPSIATMLFGLMTGQLLKGNRTAKRKLLTMFQGGAVCFLAAMAVDTTIWPVEISGCNWSFCPIVKRIWSPSWAVFSAGWSLWMLSGFYLVIDLWRIRWWSYPLAVVGMNSIAVYCMSQLLKPWVKKTLSIHLTTVDQAFGEQTVAVLFGEDNIFAPIWQSVAVVLVLWLISAWMYRRKLFVRI